MPTADTADVFGRIITRRDVNLAVVSFLRAWVPTYIAEIESQAGLRHGTLPMPPDQNLSYRQGLNWDTWEQSWSPLYIVNAEPIDRPERQYGQGVYAQVFNIEVCLNVVVTNEMENLGAAGSGGLASLVEDSAIQYADMYGMAAAAAMLQHGGLGTWPDGTPVALKSVLEQYPVTSFPYPDNRAVTRSVFTVQSIVDMVLIESDGPSSPLVDPYAGAGDWPSAKSVTAQINAVPDSSSI